MHKTGIIKKWNDEKGFGFIKSKSDKNEYFFHINSYRNSGQRPSIGLAVSFDASVDKQGRAQAVKVRSAGKEGKEKDSRDNATQYCANRWLARRALCSAAAAPQIKEGIIP